MEPQVKLSALISGFLMKTESEADSYSPVPGCKLFKTDVRPLSPTLTAVTYLLSQVQGFLVIFDRDFNNKAVCQQTFFSDETYGLYNSLKSVAIPGKSYHGSSGFFINLPYVGNLLIEYQNEGGKPCIVATAECML